MNSALVLTSNSTEQQSPRANGEAKHSASFHMSTTMRATSKVLGVIILYSIDFICTGVLQCLHGLLGLVIARLNATPLYLPCHI